MRQLKVLGVALVAMFALGITATSALALPDVSIALGGAYPLHVSGENTGATKLESTAGSKLAGKGVTLSLTTTELSALGEFTATFKGVKMGTKACESTGAGKENVVTPGTFHVVYTALNETKEGKLVSDLTLGILFLPKEVEVKCGALVILVRGSVISTLSAGTEAEELTSVSGKLEGAKGKNTLTEYYNDKGEKVKGILESEFGTGFLQSDEVVAGETKLTATEGKMFTITGR